MGPASSGERQVPPGGGWRATPQLATRARCGHGSLLARKWGPVTYRDSLLRSIHPTPTCKGRRRQVWPDVSRRAPGDGSTWLRRQSCRPTCAAVAQTLVRH
jgi:hypothetical protein